MELSSCPLRPQLVSDWSHLIKITTKQLNEQKVFFQKVTGPNLTSSNFRWELFLSTKLKVFWFIYLFVFLGIKVETAQLSQTRFTSAFLPRLNWKLHLDERKMERLIIICQFGVSLPSQSGPVSVRFPSREVDERQKNVCSVTALHLLFRLLSSNQNTNRN